MELGEFKTFTTGSYYYHVRKTFERNDSEWFTVSRYPRLPLEEEEMISQLVDEVFAEDSLDRE